MKNPKSKPVKNSRKSVGAKPKSSLISRTAAINKTNHNIVLGNTRSSTFSVDMSKISRSQYSPEETSASKRNISNEDNPEVINIGYSENNNVTVSPITNYSSEHMSNNKLKSARAEDIPLNYNRYQEPEHKSPPKKNKAVPHDSEPIPENMHSKEKHPYLLSQKYFGTQP